MEREIASDNELKVKKYKNSKENKNWKNALNKKSINQNSGWWERSKEEEEKAFILPIWSQESWQKWEIGK